MRSGDLKARVIIKQLGSIDALGQPTGTPSTIATLWAKKQPQRGREVAAAGTIAAEQTETFTIRFRNDIMTKRILEYRGISYSIEYIAEPSPKEELDLVCRRFE
jgi:SPP1 family predicted phage head-tail adaptor